MSKEELGHYAGLLYDVVEPSNSNSIAVESCAETLKLLNPALKIEMAAGIAADHDSKGKQTLTREDFSAAVCFALQTTDMGDAIQIVRDLTIRMRVAFRRRYLMYDAPASTPPDALLQNKNAVTMYRDLWDFLASGSDTITRPQLRKLAAAVLDDFPAEENNVVKAAIGDRETDTITFLEFLMVFQQASQTRPLSEMVMLARRKFDSEHDMQIQAHRKINSLVTSAGFPSDRAPLIIEQLKQNSRLQQEVQNLSTNEHVATERARSVLYTGTSGDSTYSSHPSSLNEPLPQIPSPLSPPKPAIDAALEREVAQLRTDNERLKHALAVAGGKNLQSGDARTDREAQQQSVAMVKAQRAKEEALSQRVQELENELRQARASIAISTEAADLCSLLRAPGNGGKTSVLKEHFIEEASLLGKHKYIREVAVKFEDPNSPVSLLLGQYELLISGYQALYRDLKGRWEYAKSKRFNPMEAAKNIVQQAQSAPTSSKPLSATSPLHVNSSIYSWAEIDCPPSDQLRHTGLPGDPLLTEAERNQLRAKLAAQMRSTAKHYTPGNTPRNQGLIPSNNNSVGRFGTPSRAQTPLSQAGGGYFSGSPGEADTHSGSMDAMRQLQHMTPNAARRY